MVDKKSSKKKLVIAVIFVAIVCGSAIAVSQLALDNKSGTSSSPYSNDPYDSILSHLLFEPSSLNDTGERYAIEPVWNELTKDYRPRWEGCSDEEFLAIFDELPKMPQDFYKKYKMFMEGTLTNYDRLTPDYWMQPEFFDLNQKFFDRYLQRWTGQWNIGQISCKPSFRYVEVKPGVSLQFSTFFHTDVLGTEASLGAVIYSYLPDVAMNQGGVVVFEQPDTAEQYINSRIITPDNDLIFMSDEFQEHLQGLYVNVDDNSRMVRFPATYRKIDVEGEKQLTGFPENWCYKVTVEIDISSSCPSGDYIVAVDSMNPSSAILEEYNWVISSEPYYSFFYPATREWHPVCPFFQVLITVV